MWKEVGNMKISQDGRPTGRPRERPTGASDELVRLSVNLSAEAADVLKEYAGRKGISVTEAVRRAIGILKFVDDAQERGASLNVEEAGTVKEVLFLV
jgi:hypothetical protein